MNGRRWLRVGGYTAVVLGGGLGWVIVLCMGVGLLLTTLLGGMFVPFAGLWFLAAVPVLELMVAVSALILVGTAMVAASRR